MEFRCVKLYFVFHNDYVFQNDNFDFFLDRRFIEDYQWLISDACPSNANVTMFPTKMGANPAFAFEVTEAHRRMGQIYLFCIIGLCSPIKSLTTGNLGLVSEPISQCSIHFITALASQRA